MRELEEIFWLMQNVIYIKKGKSTHTEHIVYENYSILVERDTDSVDFSS